MMRRFVITFRSLNKQFSTNYYQFDLFKHCERIKIKTKIKNLRYFMEIIALPR
jgi:hypothetical protein